MYTELDLIGLFVFAVSGALLAIHRDFDVVGIALLALITALGGGILRDLVLGDTPPPAFTQWEYLVVPLAASAVACVAHPELERLTQTLLVFDAAGLGLFCVAGTVKALEYGLPPVAAASLGVTTAVGGGVLRDVIARETPALVRPDSELYAVPAVAGAIGVVIAWELDAYEPALGAAIAAAVFAIRGLALRYHWRGPRAWQREHDARIPADSSGAGVIPDAQVNEGWRSPAALNPRTRPSAKGSPLSGSLATVGWPVSQGGPDSLMGSPNQTITMAADSETPNIINQLLKATEDEDFEAFASCFLPDGVVLDAGRTYVGRDEIIGWRKTVADGPDFTAEVTAKAPFGPGGDGYKVVEHLEGDFPGGVVDLDFLFALKGDRIGALMIFQQGD